MRHSYAYRRAEERDVGALSALVGASAFQAGGGGALLPLADGEIRELVRARAFFVAMAGDALAGCASVVEYDGLAELRSLIVAPEHRARGVGRALVALCMDEARARGYAELLALTRDEAMPLLERSGFRREPRPPEKLARDCARCPLLDAGCNEVAVVAAL